MNFDHHITEISRLRREADKLIDDNPETLMQKIDCLARCLVYIGRVSSALDGEYKRIYAKRKFEYAKAEIAAKPPRQAHAELAVAELRALEAQAYEDMQRWRNAFESTQEEIHALKLRMRIDFADGGMDYGTQSRTETQLQANQAKTG